MTTTRVLDKHLATGQTCFAHAPKGGPAGKAEGDRPIICRNGEQGVVAQGD